MSKYKVVRNHDRSVATVDAMKAERLLQKKKDWQKTVRKGVENWKKKPCKIKPFSEKRMKENGVYKKVRNEFLETYNECQAKISNYCKHESTDVHHKQKRRTEDQRLNPNHWMAVCRPCHLWIESHDEQSRKLGFIENGLT